MIPNSISKLNEFVLVGLRNGKLLVYSFENDNLDLKHSFVAGDAPLKLFNSGDFHILTGDKQYVVTHTNGYFNFVPVDFAV